MRTILLLIALFLLLIFGIDIIGNYLQFAFYWGDLIYYLVPAIIIYLIITFVGRSLNKKFDTQVSSFVSGSGKDLDIRPGLLRTFGLLIITLLPFLGYLMAVGLFAAIDFSLYGLWAISYLPRVPIAILVGFFVVAVGTALAMVIGIYYLLFPPKPKTLGLEVNEHEQGKLWGVATEVAEKVGTKRVDRIIIKPNPGIGVYQYGGLLRNLFGGGARVLEIGLPSVNGLTVDEFKSILAHEYGHFNNNDTRWGSFTHAMGNSLVRTIQAMPGPRKVEDGEEVGWVRGMMTINPAYWLLFVYVFLYFKVTNGFSRIREVMADINAMKLYGGNNLSSGLITVSLNDTLFSEVVEGKHIMELLKEGKTIRNFTEYLQGVYKSAGKKAVEELREGIVNSDKEVGAYNSHPPLHIRIEYAKRYGSGTKAAAVPVETLFTGWNELNEKIADQYNDRLIGAIKTYSEAVEKAEQQANKEQPFWNRETKFTRIAKYVILGVVGLVILLFVVLIFSEG